MRGQDVARRPTGRRRNGWRKPLRDLPIAARPAVKARHPGQVVARILVDDVDVAAERGTREQSLEEVVAEETVLGNAPVERRFERVDVEDALADEVALFE